MRQRLLVNERLAASPCAVFYDSSQSVSGGDNYRYQAKGVCIEGRFFHPKNIVVAGYSEQGHPCVFVSAASANLTRRAWARNEESYAFLWITTQKQQAYKVLQKFCVSFLLEKCKGENIEALERMIDFLKQIPDGNNRMPDYDGELYFSPLMTGGKGFAEFLSEDAERKRKLLTVYSPYWGKEVIKLLKRIKADSYILRPSYFVESNSYGLDKQQLKQIEINKEYVFVEGEIKPRSKEARFRHAKMYVLESSMSNKVRLGIGSCNCTDPGLSGADGNVESMIVMDIDTRQARDLVGAGTELSFEDVETVLIEEEEAPEQPPFTIEVLLDWNTRNYHVTTQLFKGNKIESFRLYLPGVTQTIDLQQISGADDIALESDPGSKRTFEVVYTVKRTENEIRHKGLIFEINLLHSDRNYFPKLRIQDILEGWRHRDNDDHWIERAGDGSDGSDTSDDRDSSKPGLEESAKQKVEEEQNVLGYYDIYRGFYDLRQRFETSIDQDTINRFVVSRPDSIYAVLTRLPKSGLDLATRFIILKECDILVGYLEKQPRIKVNAEVARLLRIEMEKARTEMDAALSDSVKDRGHLRKVGAAGARSWFEAELERAWK